MQEIVNGNPVLRKRLYTAYAIIALVLAATEVGFRTAGVEVPTPVDVATAVVLFLGGAFGFGAQAKVNATPVVIPDGSGEHRAEG